MSDLDEYVFNASHCPEIPGNWNLEQIRDYMFDLHEKCSTEDILNETDFCQRQMSECYQYFRANFKVPAFLAFGIFMAFFCAIGLVGSVASLIIFLHRRMRSPINTLLWFLTLMDFCLLALSIPVLVLPTLHHSRYMNIDTILLLTYVSTQYLYPVLTMTQTATIWVLVLISFERYRAVCKPFTVYRNTSEKRNLIPIVIIFVFSICYNFIRFWEHKPNEEDPLVLSDHLKNDTRYINFYFTGCYLVTHFLVPFSILLYLNINLVVSLRNTAALVKGSKNVSARRDTSGSSKPPRSTRRSTTIMIIVVTAAFFIGNTLPFVLNIWEASNREEFKDDPRVFMVIDISSSLVIANSALNSAIYFCFCTHYRNLFKLLFTCRWTNYAEYGVRSHITCPSSTNLLGPGSARKSQYGNEPSYTEKVYGAYPLVSTYSADAGQLSQISKDHSLRTFLFRHNKRDLSASSL